MFDKCLITCNYLYSKSKRLRIPLNMYLGVKTTPYNITYIIVSKYILRFHGSYAGNHAPILSFTFL